MPNPMLNLLAIQHDGQVRFEEMVGGPDQVGMGCMEGFAESKTSRSRWMRNGRGGPEEWPRQQVFSRNYWWEDRSAATGIDAKLAAQAVDGLAISGGDRS